MPDYTYTSTHLGETIDDAVNRALMLPSNPASSSGQTLLSDASGNLTWSSAQRYLVYKGTVATVQDLPTYASSAIELLTHAGETYFVSGASEYYSFYPSTPSSLYGSWIPMSQSVLYAVYDATTPANSTAYADMYAAYTANKIIVLVDNITGQIAYLQNQPSSTIYFTGIDAQNRRINRYRCSSTNTWSVDSISLGGGGGSASDTDDIAVVLDLSIRTPRQITTDDSVTQAISVLNLLTDLMDTKLDEDGDANNVLVERSATYEFADIPAAAPITLQDAINYLAGYYAKIAHEALVVLTATVNYSTMTVIAAPTNSYVDIYQILTDNRRVVVKTTDTNSGQIEWYYPSTIESSPARINFAKPVDGARGGDMQYITVDERDAWRLNNI